MKIKKTGIKPFASDIKISLFYALIVLIIVMIPLAAKFGDGYFMGYEILAGPGIFVASFFSEEINLLPKLAIMIVGQYLIYTVFIFLC